MLNIFFRFALVFLPFLCYSAENSVKSQMLSDLDYIGNTLKITYAPAEWKKVQSGWDVDTEISKAKQKVISADKITPKEFHKIVKEFFKSTKDYHVSVLFYSTEYAKLPFRIRGSQGRYFFSYVDENKLSPEVFGIQVGDELLQFNNRPIHEVVQELKEKSVGDSSRLTDQRLAENSLTSKFGMFGDDVPKGPVTITVRSAGATKVSNYQLIWDYHPEKVKNEMALAKSKLAVKRAAPSAQNPLLAKTFLNPRYEQTKSFLGADKTAEANDQEGSRKSYIPPLGKIIWQSDEDDHFYAYLFETEDHRLIGYIRIAHYIGSEDSVREFENLITYFQTRSEALIIDQINNPGGSAFYLYALLSMLTEQPLYAPLHRMSITQSEVFHAALEIPLFEAVESDDDARLLLGESLEGIPVTYQMAKFVLNYYRFIVDEWEAGHRLTSPFYLYGVDQINPYPSVHYTKPILLVINELDASCADFFPAILQDNGRVVTLGAETAGAGGYITSSSFKNINGIAFFQYTASLAERINNSPIENLGVTPDIKYEISPEDLEFGYQEYKKAILEAVQGLLK